MGYISIKVENKIDKVEENQRVWKPNQFWVKKWICFRTDLRILSFKWKRFICTTLTENYSTARECNIGQTHIFQIGYAQRNKKKRDYWEKFVKVKVYKQRRDMHIFTTIGSIQFSILLT